MSGSEGDGSAVGVRSPRAPRGRDAAPGRKSRPRSRRRGEGSSNLPSKRTDLLLALGLWILAFVHRALFLFSNVDHDWGFTVFYEGDSETFYNFARSILAGMPYDGGIPFHPPLWPHVLAGIHLLVGAGAAASQVPHVEVKLWTAAIGACAPPLLFLLAERYLGRGIALVSALATVYSFGLYVVSVAPVTESLYLALLLASLLVVSTTEHPLAPGAIGRPVPEAPGLGRRPAGIREERRRDARAPVTRVAAGNRTTTPGDWAASIGLGVLLGLLCLTRAEGVLLTVLVVGLGIAGTGRATALSSRIPWLTCIVAAALVILPWTIRNGRALEVVNARFASSMAEPLPTFVPITAYGPLNFALANNELADGTFSRAILTSRAESATLEVTDPQHLEYFLHGYRIGVDWIRTHPAGFARLVLRKWALFFGAGTLGFTQWDLPGGLDGLRRPVDLFVPNARIEGWIFFPLLLLGSAQLLRAGGAPRRWAFLGLLVTGAGMVSSGLFFGYARLGVLAFPFWVCAGVAGIAATVQSLRRTPHDADSPSEESEESKESKESRESRESKESVFRWAPHFRSKRERLTWLLPIAVLLALEIWGATGDRNFEATGTQADGASHLNPHDTMHLKVISKK